MLKWLSTLFMNAVTDTYEYVSVTKNNKNSQIVLRVKVNGEEKEFVGSGTVWHTYPEFKRCPTYIESTLYDIWSKLRYEGVI